MTKGTSLQVADPELWPFMPVDVRPMSAIVLVDGAQLARCMVDHEIGVQRKAELRLYRVDDDFFEATE